VPPSFERGVFVVAAPFGKRGTVHGTFKAK
jgi:hypothetical protein